MVATALITFLVIGGIFLLTCLCTACSEYCKEKFGYGSRQDELDRQSEIIYFHRPNPNPNNDVIDSGRQPEVFLVMPDHYRKNTNPPSYDEALKNEPPPAYEQFQNSSKY